MLGDKKPRLMGRHDINKIIKDEMLDEHKYVKSITFTVGEDVVLTDGPFASFNGTIMEIKGDKVELQVKIFGRLTPVTIDIQNIKKI
jgi:transcriptional antiterminator NusG